MRFLICAIIAQFLSGPVLAKTEPEWSAEWCEANGGVAEYRFDDGTRADCITSTHAIEFDWANKWAEGIGQSLHYAANSGRRAGVMLLLKKESDMRYFERLQLLVNHYGLPVDVWYLQTY